jgi:hypothetical protein
MIIELNSIHQLLLFSNSLFSTLLAKHNLIVTKNNDTL